MFSVLRFVIEPFPLLWRRQPPNDKPQNIEQANVKVSYWLLTGGHTGLEATIPLGLTSIDFFEERWLREKWDATCNLQLRVKPVQSPRVVR